MQKVPVKDREIKHYHEVLPKEERPEQGGRYLVSMNDEPTYVADITEFKGGCWAKVRVVEPANEKYAHLYTKSMEFEIKVAHYGFQSLKEGQADLESTAASTTASGTGAA